MGALNVVEGRVRNKIAGEGERNSNSTGTSEIDTLVFPVHYFEGIYEFKKLVHSLNNEFHQLIGDTRMFPKKKRKFPGKLIGKKQTVEYR